MKPSVLLDYEFAVSAGVYTVRALLLLEGKAPERSERIPLNLSLVLDRSDSMHGQNYMPRRKLRHSWCAALIRRTS